MAGTYDIYIEQGATFRQSIVWNGAGSPVNLTGYSARMQIRQSVRSPAVLEELTTVNGGIILTAGTGTIELYLTAVQTAALSRNGVYDLELVDGGGAVTRLLEGSVTLSPEVTR